MLDLAPPSGVSVVDGVRDGRVQVEADVGGIGLWFPRHDETVQPTGMEHFLVDFVEVGVGSVHYISMAVEGATYSKGQYELSPILRCNGDIRSDLDGHRDSHSDRRGHEHRADGGQVDRADPPRCLTCFIRCLQKVDEHGLVDAEIVQHRRVGADEATLARPRSSLRQDHWVR